LTSFTKVTPNSGLLELHAISQMNLFLIKKKRKNLCILPLKQKKKKHKVVGLLLVNAIQRLFQ